MKSKAYTILQSGTNQQGKGYFWNSTHLLEYSSHLCKIGISENLGQNIFHNWDGTYRIYLYSKRNHNYKCIFIHRRLREYHKEDIFLRFYRDLLYRHIRIHSIIRFCHKIDTLCLLGIHRRLCIRMIRFFGSIWISGDMLVQLLHKFTYFYSKPNPPCKCTSGPYNMNEKDITGRLLLTSRTHACIGRHHPKIIH